MKEFRVLKINVSPASLGMRPGSRQVVMLPSTPPSLPPKKKRAMTKGTQSSRIVWGLTAAGVRLAFQNCHEKKRSRTWSCSATPTEKKKKTLRGVTIFDCGNLQMSSETMRPEENSMSLVGHKGGMTDGRSASDDNTSGLLALCCPRNVYRYDLRERAERDSLQHSNNCNNNLSSSILWRCCCIFLKTLSRDKFTMLM